ncbi:hypothetical protein P3744_19310 [Vibrio parahaemolyticus]|nr:hypothetical protein [Vibrio parahaemolyticus]
MSVHFHKLTMFVTPEHKAFATLCGGQAYSGFSLIAQNERHE